MDIFSGEEKIYETDEPEVSQNSAIHGLIATAETLTVNAVFMAFNNFVTHESWAHPEKESIHNSFTQPWEWDEGDGFIVNHLGHPAQGSQYFVSGRINSFNFYQSYFFSALGSFTWEVICENHGSAMNDFIVTTTASMPFGEMLYRMYVEAYAAGVPAPLAFIINPMAGLHHLITGWQPPDYGRNMHQLKMYAGGGFSDIYSSAQGFDGNIFSFSGPFAYLGFSFIYGNPFLSESRVPYSQFELEMSFGMDIGEYLEGRIVSDGYLFSFSPVHSNSNLMSTGLSLHWDSIIQGRFNKTDATINMYNSALNWAVKYQHLFSQDFSFQAKICSGITPMGAGTYYSTERLRDLAFYGFGMNSKILLALEHTEFGKLETSAFSYRQWNYPGTSKLSGGNIYWLFTDLAYSYNITKNLSLGILYSFVMERGFFDNQPDTSRTSNTAKCYIAWYW